MTTRPEEFRWVPSQDPAKVTEPSTTKKDNGFFYEEPPPFQYINYLLNLVDRWFDYIESTSNQFVVTESPLVGMSVEVLSGIIFYNNTVTEVAPQTLSGIVAPTTNPRIDRVVIDLDGVASIVTGTEDASPVPPDPPLNTRPLARVSLATSTTLITNDDIENDRSPIYEPRADVLSQAANQFRLVLSGGDLTLERAGGNAINIDGKIRQITGATPTLAATGLTPDTNYFIYAYWTGSAVALEASVTTYVVGTSGRPEKSGDVTRRLIGLARVITGPAWINSESQRFVISYDNKRRLVLRNAFTANRQDTTQVWDEFNSEIRCEFLLWDGDMINITLHGSWRADTPFNTGGDYNIGVGFNGSQPNLGGENHIGKHFTNGDEFEPVSLTVSQNNVDIAPLVEGYNYASVWGYMPSGGGAGHTLAGHTSNVLPGTALTGHILG